MTLWIGLVGRARGGKSTAAGAMLKEARYLDLNAELFEISSYLLAEAVDRKLVGNKPREELDKEEIKRLVEVGQERRAEDPEHWLKLLGKDILTKKPDVALVPNVRFRNEAELIQRNGGKVVRVTALICDSVEFVSEDRNPNDASEVEHYSIQADYFLTTRRGESDLLKLQASTLFRYLYGKRN